MTEMAIDHVRNKAHQDHSFWYNGALKTHRNWALDAEIITKVKGGSSCMYKKI